MKIVMMMMMMLTMMVMMMMMTMMMSPPSRQSEAEDSQDVGEEEEDDDEDEEEEEYRGWTHSSTSSHRGVGRARGGGIRGGAMHEDSTATSFSDITLYMEEGEEGEEEEEEEEGVAASSCDTEYWSGGEGAAERSGEYKGRRASVRGGGAAAEGGGGRGHLPVLTIEPPSDSSMDMSDR